MARFGFSALLAAAVFAHAASVIQAQQPADPFASPPAAVPPAPVAPGAPAYPGAPAFPGAAGVPGAPGTPAVTEEQQLVRMLQDLQDQIELDTRLAGTLILGGQLVPRDEGGQTLIVRGRFAAEDQVQLLTDLFPPAIAADPYWSAKQDDVFVDLRGMPVLPPSGVFASRYYGLGLEFFWRRDYAAADRAFARAIAEAPTFEAYRWWSVLTAIALGQDQRAMAKLQPLLAVDPYGSQSPAIAYELMEVQGPLRWKLQALERVVLLNDVLVIPPPVPAEPVQEVRAPGRRSDGETGGRREGGIRPAAVVAQAE